MSGTAGTWLWVGTYGMLAGTVILAIMGYKLKAEERYHAALAAIITGIAATAYFAMAKGIGDRMVGDVTIQTARYIDWVVTTPLLLLSLIVVGVPKLKGLGWTVTSVLIIDVYMIVTGLVAGLVDGEAKAVLYIVSCVALVAIAAYLFGPVLAKAKESGAAGAKMYQNLAAYLGVLWLAYPIVWVLGPTGSGSFGFGVENALYAILDLLAKAVFGIIIVTGIKKLPANAS